MDEKITLIKVNVIGRKYFHSFKMNDGTFVDRETNAEDYRQLATEQHIDPTIKDGKYHNSVELYKFDTIDGDLADGQYCDNGNGYLIKNGGYFIQAKKDEVVDSKIQTSVVTDAISRVALSQKITVI